MNKEYKYLNDETIEIKDENKKIFQRKINCHNQTEMLELENKIETIDNMIKDMDKKINLRKEFINFVPKWIKMHLLFPIFTLALIVISCITGWINAIYSFVLSCFLFSVAIISTTIIAGIAKYFATKDLNGLSVKLEVSKEMKKDLEKELLREVQTSLNPSKTTNFELNKPIKLEETLTMAETRVLSEAFSKGFNQRVKKLVKTKNNFTG